MFKLLKKIASDIKPFAHSRQSVYYSVTSLVDSWEDFVGRIQNGNEKVVIPIELTISVDSKINQTFVVRCLAETLLQGGD
jgi:hypothetical protein